MKIGDKVRRIGGPPGWDAWAEYTAPKDPHVVYSVTGIRGDGLEILTNANRYWWASQYFEVVSQDTNEYI